MAQLMQLHSPFTPFRNAFIRDLKEIADEELLDLFYTHLRWINYFQDEDDLYTYLKIFEDVRMEVKRRELSIKWSNKDIKKYRILGQKMYYGSLSVKELEWRLGILILHAIPVYRKFVRSKLYLVRERIHILLDAIHENNYWTELEYNKDLLAALDAPFFSYDNFRDMYRVARAFFLVSENVIIFIVFVLCLIMRLLRPLWNFFDPDGTCLGRIQVIVRVFLFFAISSWYIYNN